MLTLCGAKHKKVQTKRLFLNFIIYLFIQMNASSHSVSDFCCVRRTFHEKHLLRVFSQKAAFVENNYNTSVFEGGGGGVRAG